jgi:hypothetical protein
MKGRQHVRREFFECPHCGADVPVGSKACRECGSDAATGWVDDEDVELHSVDLPQGYSRDDDHPAGGGTGGYLPEKRSPVLAIVAVVLVLLFVVLAVMAR